jgi:hypothetical protein
MVAVMARRVARRHAVAMDTPPDEGSGGRATEISTRGAQQRLEGEPKGEGLRRRAWGRRDVCLLRGCTTAAPMVWSGRLHSYYCFGLLIFRLL